MRYRKIIDGIHDAVFVESTAGKIIDVNQSACELYGYSREEFLKISVDDLVPMGYLRISSHQQDGKESEPQSVETVNLRANKEIFPVEVTAKWVDFEGERLLVVVARDISEKKRIEVQQQATLQISQAANMTVSLEEFIDKVHLILNLLMPAKNLYVALCETGSDDLSFLYYSDEKQPHFLAENSHLEINLIKKVINTGQPLLAAPEAIAELLAGQATPANHPVTWLGVPLRTTPGNPLGILAVKSYSPEIQFFDKDLELLVFVSSQIALTIERRRVEEKMYQSEDRYRSLVRNVPIALCRTGADPRGRLIMVNPAFMEMFGCSSELEALKLSLPELYFQSQDWFGVYDELVSTGSIAGKEQRFKTCSGSILWGWLTGRVIRKGNGAVEALDLTIQNITQRVRRDREREAQIHVSESLIHTPDLIQLLNEVLDSARRAIPAAEMGSVLMIDRSTNQLVIQASFGYADTWAVGTRLPLNKGYAARSIKEGRPLLIGSMASEPGSTHPIGVPGNASIKSAVVAPLISQGRVLGALLLENRQIENSFNEDDRDLLLTFSASVSAAIESMYWIEESRKKIAELSAITQVSAALRSAKTSADIFPVVIEPLLLATGADGVLLALRNQFTGDILIEKAYGIWASLAGTHLPAGQGHIGSVIQSPRTLVWQENYEDPLYNQMVYPGRFKVLVCTPLIAQERTLGALCIGRQAATGEGDANLIAAIGDMIANALHRLSLIEQTERRLQHLQALHSIDQAIASSLDLRLTLNILLEQVTLELRVDAAQVFLLTPYLHLEFAAGRGFRSQHSDLKVIRPNEGPAGKAVMERRTVVLATAEELRSHPLYDDLLAEERFTCCIAEPLIAKGQVIGVLETFQRAPLNPDPDWQEFLVSLAGQAAIAVDNAQLLDKLQRSNIELASAYDATIEGWSRALDLRDRETEGHTQRVTLWTERLARELKVPEEDIIHIRRGALLHDIGKMGIPDNILLKPGPLTDDEWEIMRKHPEYANQLLSPIQFLRPALLIPYSHHERWDGNGYPHGLRGERIPLPARMFSLVDVWDAITSDRPYRAAWPPLQALEYIAAQSGSWFDPEITRVFLRMVHGSHL